MTTITTPSGKRVHEVDYRFGGKVPTVGYRFGWRPTGRGLRVMLMCGRQIPDGLCTETDEPVTCLDCIAAGERRTE